MTGEPNAIMSVSVSGLAVEGRGYLPTPLSSKDGTAGCGKAKHGEERDHDKDCGDKE